MGVSFMTVRTSQLICVCNILMGNLLLFNWRFPTGVHQSVGMFIVKITMVGVFQESAHSCKITMRIIQLSRNIQRENIIFSFGLKWLHTFGF